jgi:hypothetical protein
MPISGAVTLISNILFRVRKHDQRVRADDVHQDVQRTSLVTDAFDPGVPLLLVGHFQLDEEAFAAPIDDLLSQRFAAFLITARNGDNCPLLGKQTRRGASHPP